MINILLFLSYIIITNIIINKLNFLPNYSGSDHQKFTNEANVPLSGGIFILSTFIVLFYSQFDLIFFFVVIFLIGLASDKNFLISPKKRLILQIFTVLFFVIFFNLVIFETRIDLINYFLSYNLISYIFASFCILVLINGSNFIDGLNSLLLGYFLIILYIAFRLDLLIQIGLENNDVYFLFSILFFLLFLNYFNFLFLGDGGSYLIGLFLSFLLISIYNLNIDSLSPYFIIVLLWYPCFENLFSIIRKKVNHSSPIHADNMHLHQLIFIFFQNIINLEKKYLNSLVSVLINLFNLAILHLASIYYNNSMFQIIILFFSVTIYLVLYFFLSKKYTSSFIKK